MLNKTRRKRKIKLAFSLNSASYPEKEMQYTAKIGWRHLNFFFLLLT